MENEMTGAGPALVVEQLEAQLVGGSDNPMKIEVSLHRKGEEPRARVRNRKGLREGNPKYFELEIAHNGLPGAFETAVIEALTKALITVVAARLPRETRAILAKTVPGLTLLR